MVYKLVEQISQVSAFGIEKVLNAVLSRYAELFPDWEVSTISLYKCSDRDEQLDRIIEMLQKMKKYS